MRRVVLLLTTAMFAWLAAPQAAAAQTGTVRGQVTTQDGAALSGAQVSVVGTNRGSVTNAQGGYLILNVPAGTHTLRVQSLGYAMAEASITVQAGGTVTRDFQLTQEAIGLQGIDVTVGSRARHTAADELAVPVDVFPQQEIAQTAQVEMTGVLQELAPSVHFERGQINDLTSGVRPFTLRGLSPDHSLVLINGKRRHPTAVVHVFGAANMTSGSSGVDMNAIPTAAVGRMEILRDGAAAQYGSDAIAGVVNLNLRDDVHAPEFSIQAGRYFPDNYDSDGNRLDIMGNWGLALGDRGTLNITGAYQNRQPTQRAGPDPRDQIIPGDGNVVDDIDGDGINEIVERNNDVPMPNHLTGDGEAEGGSGFYNLRYALGERQDHQFYSFGGFSYREDVHSGFYRRGLDNRNWPNVHPIGFLPKFRGKTRDAMAVAGFSGFMGENTTYDVGASWGQNNLDLDIFNSHNVSLGPCLDTPCAPGRDGILGTADDPGVPNKTDMFAGILQLNQYNVTADMTHLVDIGTAQPLNIAFGAAFRADNYVIEAGETASWINGYHPNRSGGTAAVGAQVFTGYRPDQEVDDTRTNFGVYADLENDLTDEFLLAVAGRFESYSDFGETLTGKIAARLQPSEAVIFRGAASTGFRAPSQSQKFYAHTSTGFQDDPNNPGNQIAFEIGEFPVGSPEAQALGAEPLEEETSVNFSLGIAVTPAEGFNITVDGYRITVDDRIILTGTMSGDAVETLLAERGLPGSAVKFFTNSVDTRTYGIDVTARWQTFWGQDERFESVFSYNFNDMKVTDVHIPDVISELRDQVFDAFDQAALEDGRPQDRFRLALEYGNGPFTVGATGNYYGTVTDLIDEINEELFETGPHLVFDANVGYELVNGLHLSVGVENLFDEFPTPQPDGENFLGIFVYGPAPFGVNGRHVYTQLRAALP